MNKGSSIHISRFDIEDMDRITRLNLVNHISGYKSANLVGTVSREGQSNVSIVSSVVHLSSSPAVLGFVQRPTTVPRHTFRNIIETEFFTLNHVHEGITDKAHYTSAKFDNDESEFEHCGLKEEYRNGFPAPFVGESRFKMALRYLNHYDIYESNTMLVVGMIESIHMPRESLKDDGQIDFDALETVAVSGLNNYHQVQPLASYAYARPGAFPSNLLQSEAPHPKIKHHKT